MGDDFGTPSAERRRAPAIARKQGALYGQRSVEPTLKVDDFGNRKPTVRPHSLPWSLPRSLKSLFGWPWLNGARLDLPSLVSMRLRRRRERPIRGRAPVAELVRRAEGSLSRIPAQWWNV